jgi:hypothetical protein
MKIYLVGTAYEGNADVAFSSQELAEQYLIANGGDSVIVIDLDGNGAYADTTPSPMLEAHYAKIKADSKEMWAKIRDYQDNQIHSDCGLVNRECQCWAETNCGEFGGVTKKGTACLNPVLINNSEKCHLHR